MRSSLALSESDTSGCLPDELWAQPTVLGWHCCGHGGSRQGACTLYKVVDEVAKIEQKVKKGPFFMTVGEEAL